MSSLFPEASILSLILQNLRSGWAERDHLPTRGTVDSGVCLPSPLPPRTAAPERTSWPPNASEI